MVKVPLVHYRDGERVVIGEADVSIEPNGDMTVKSTIVDKDTTLFKVEDSFSVYVKPPDEPKEVAWIPSLGLTSKSSPTMPSATSDE